jgi:hypothetical protein
MEKNKNLRKQQKLTNQLNNLLEISANSLTCGPSCQREKNLKTLQQNYLDAQTAVQTAPLHLEDSKKQYITLKDGEAAYNRMRLAELEKEADGLISKIKQTFEEQIKHTIVLTRYLDTELTNSQNTEELLEDVTATDMFLGEKIKDKMSQVVTNDRKSYYETQELDRLNMWSSIFTTIYFILLIVLTIEIAFSDTLRLPVKFIILLVLYLYPFVINSVVLLLYKLIAAVGKSIYFFFPKNAYTDI